MKEYTHKLFIHKLLKSTIQPHLQLTTRTLKQLIMRLASTPQQRARLYRFIDAYPALVTDQSLEQHINEYLSADITSSLEDDSLSRLINSYSRSTSLAHFRVNIVKYLMDKVLEATSIIADANDITSQVLDHLREQTGPYIDLLGPSASSLADGTNYMFRTMNLLDILNNINKYSTLSTVNTTGLTLSNPLQYRKQNKAIFALALRPHCMSPYMHPLRIDRGLVDIKEKLLVIADKARASSTMLVFESENSEFASKIVPLLFKALEQSEYDKLELGIVIQADWLKIRDILNDLLTISDRRISKGLKPLTARLSYKPRLDIRKKTLVASGWPNQSFESTKQVEDSFTYCLEFLCKYRDRLYPAFEVLTQDQLSRVLQAISHFGPTDGPLELHLTPMLMAEMHAKRAKNGVKMQEIVPQIGGESIVERTQLPISDVTSLSRHVVDALDSMLASSAATSIFSHNSHWFPRLRQTLSDSANQHLRNEVHERIDNLPLDKSEFHRGSPLDKGSPLDNKFPRMAAIIKKTTHSMDSSSFELEPAIEWHRQELRDVFSKLISQILLRPAPEIGAMIAGHARWGTGSIEALDPADPNRIIFQSTCCGRAEVEQAVRAADSSSEAWTKRQPHERAEIALLTAEWLRRYRLELAASEVVEVGKTWIEADADVCGAIDFCEYHARAILNAPKRSGSISQDGTYLSKEVMPRGVGVVLPSWSSPLAKAADVIMKTLMSGNTLILLPSSVQITNLLHMLTEALLNAGLPDGVISLLTGQPHHLLDLISVHPEVGFIVSSGSLLPSSSKTYYERIEKISEGLPGRVLPAGTSPTTANNAMIIDDDADLSLAVDAILTSAFSYAGQYDHSISKLIVLDQVKEPLLAQVEAVLSSLIIGPPTSMETQLGPVLNSQTYTELSTAIDRASSTGRLLFHRDDLPESGFYVAPTLLAASSANHHGNSSASSMNATTGKKQTLPYNNSPNRDNLRGPILIVEEAQDFEHAIHLANHNGWAFAGSVISRTPSHIHKTIRMLRAHCISINKPTTDLRAESTYLTYLAARDLQDGQSYEPMNRYADVKLISESTEIGGLMLPESARFSATP